MGEEIVSGLTIFSILYGVGFTYSFLTSNYWLTLIIGFVGVLLIIGLSLRIDEQERKRKKEHKATLVDIENLKREIKYLKNP